MFPIIPPVSQRRYIDEGRVFCPTRGRDVEVDVCAGCAMASDIRTDVEMAYVRCRPQPVLAPMRWMP